MNAIASHSQLRRDTTMPCEIPDTMLHDGTRQESEVPERFRVSSRNDWPVVATLNFLFNEAAEHGYSDIHFEAGTRGLRVRIRQFGVLSERVVLDGSCGSDVNRILRARACVPENEDVAPKDGTFWFRADTRTVDVRLSFLTTRDGRSIVCRLLDQTNATRPFSEIPMAAMQRERFTEALYASEGLILSVGPTGSGKTSTLYSCLNERNTPNMKLVTVEDPVEYTLEGVQQVNVIQPARSFATVVRAALRQDFDVGLIGEIRDRETAVAGVDVSNTGHLVLSTLHANTSISSINRLLVGLGADRFALAAALRLIVGQRLLRRICTSCREFREITEHEQRTLTGRGYSPASWSQHRSLVGLYIATRNPQGCEACDHKGTKGVIPVLEMLDGTHDVRRAIEENNVDLLRESVTNQPTYRTLNHAALDVALNEQTVDFNEALACAAAA